MDSTDQDKPGLFESSRRVLRTAVATLENRLELFLVELHEEKFRILNALLLVGALVIVGFLALLLVSVTLIVAFWDTARLAVLISLSAVYSVAALAIYWRLKALFDNWPAFRASLDELKKDRECLDKEK
jgi:uncharacterized membrane protein YqjE